MSLCVLKCKEVYNPPSTKNNPDFLVVDGVVIAGNDSTIITLSRTKSLTDSAPTAKELEARVSVIDVSGVEYALTEQGEGRYVASQLPLDATTSYQLKIITKDGNEFRSDPGKVNTSPPIDSVFWQQDSSGVQIYLNTHDPGNGTRYYQWEYIETWEFHSAFDSFLEYIDENNIVFRGLGNQIFRCYVTRPSSVIEVATTTRSMPGYECKPVSYVRYFTVAVGRRIVGGKHLGKCRAIEEDLRGVVDPHDQDDHGGRRAVCGGKGGLPQVEADEELARREEQRCDDGAEHDILPFDAHFGQNLVDRRKQRGDHDKRNQGIRKLEHAFQTLQMLRRERTQGRNPGIHRQRYDEQESDRQDQSEGHQARTQQVGDPLQAGMLMFRHLPDRIQCVAKLDEDPRCSEQEGQQAESGGEDALGRIARALQQRPDSVRPLRPDQAFDLAEELGPERPAVQMRGRQSLRRSGGGASTITGYRTTDWRRGAIRCAAARR